MQITAKKLWSFFLAVLMVLTILPAIAKPAEVQAAFATVSYKTHVQSYGWMGTKRDGQASGTTGQSKRIEAIRIVTTGVSGGIQYKTHVQSIGWEKDWKSNGAISGTYGQSKRVEAIQIKLTGAIANQYDVQYRVHCQRVGWTNWVKNGETAGTTGRGLRMEAIEIKLTAKTHGVNHSESVNLGVTDTGKPSIAYKAHVQSYGWMPVQRDGATAGTVGKAKRLEALLINISGVKGGIRYSTHVQGIGWQDWKQNGQMAGTTGQAKRIESIKIELTGDAAKSYDVYYRTHCQTYGWMGWAKNGQEAGTSNGSLRMEAIEIKLLKKGNTPSGYDASKAAYKKLTTRRKNLILGDSRGCVLSKTITGSQAGNNGNLDCVDTGWVTNGYGTNRIICQWGGSLWWNAQNAPGGWVGQTVKRVIESEDLSNTNIFVTIGGNEMNNTSSSVAYTQSHNTFFSYLMSHVRGKNVKVYLCTVGPWQDGWHENIRQSFNSSVNTSGAGKIDPWPHIQIGYSDTAHYDMPTCERWYNYMISQAPRFSE